MSMFAYYHKIMNYNVETESFIIWIDNNKNRVKTRFSSDNQSGKNRTNQFRIIQIRSIQSNVDEWLRIQKF